VHDQRKSAKAIVRAEQSAQILLRGLKTIAPELVGQPLLDVGCASGELLYVLQKKHHWCNNALWGIEPSQRSVEIAANRYGLHVTSLDPAEARFADGQFSIISIVNTVEHLKDPRSMLAWLHRLLAPNGCVLIATIPNVNCFDSFCFPEGFIAKNFPDGQHHFQFTPTTLSKLCAAEGFKTIRLDGETRESVDGRITETAIWLAYNCGVPLDTCSDLRRMLREFKAIVAQKHKDIVRQQGSEYQFRWWDGDFSSPESVVAFWRREIWPSPYLSDEFDLWIRK
jgi:2-polyprenyl-3-methyl-5-hydroxy-6-metoxy-1,4-benzoquinol methylase